MNHYDSIRKAFKTIGARLKLVGIEDLPSRLADRINGYQIDVSRDRGGEFFQLVIRDDSIGLFATNLCPRDHHLLLADDGVTIGNGSAAMTVKHKFLCGHDERHWFVASVPKKVSTVREAKEALKPRLVVEAQRRFGVKPKNLHRHKNAAFIRQGEWFFVPAPDMNADERLILFREPISRGTGKPHMVEQLYREGGVDVLVSDEYPKGLTDPEYRRLLRDNPRMKNIVWRHMTRDPEAYARGRVWHPDHKTIVLPFWHRIAMNNETTYEYVNYSPSVFLD